MFVSRAQWTQLPHYCMGYKSSKLLQNRSWCCRDDTWKPLDRHNEPHYRCSLDAHRAFFLFLLVSMAVLKFFLYSLVLGLWQIILELLYPNSLYSEVLFSSSFSISVFPGWHVSPGGGNSKAPLLPAKAIKWHSDAQADKAEVLQSTAAAPELWAGVPGLPFHWSHLWEMVMHWLHPAVSLGQSQCLDPAGAKCSWISQLTCTSGY